MKKNPTPEEMLEDHAARWKHVGWDADDDDDDYRNFVFEVRCPDNSDLDGDKKQEAEAAVRETILGVMNEAMGQPTGQRAFTGKGWGRRGQKPKVPSGIFTEVGFGSYYSWIELDVDRDTFDSQFRRFISAFDALDANFDKVEAVLGRYCKVKKAANPSKLKAKLLR